jgi:hypothetical protein
MIILEEVQDDEVVVVAKFDINGESTSRYEVPINADIRLVKGMTKNKKSQRRHFKPDDASSPKIELYQDPLYMNVTSEPMLP